MVGVGEFGCGIWFWFAGLFVFAGHWLWLLISGCSMVVALGLYWLWVLCKLLLFADSWVLCLFLGCGCDGFGCFVVICLFALDLVGGHLCLLVAW